MSQQSEPNALSQDPTLGPQLDILLEQARDHLQLQMLLIEVAACDEHADFSLIVEAYHFARSSHEGQTRKSGTPFLHHCVEVARILAQLRLDADTVAAGLLHDVLEDTPATFDGITQHFGAKIASLIDGVTKIDRFQYQSREARQAETYRKMLLSMVEDIRVILIKFADRLHNIRTLEHVSPAQQQRIARETIEVYAPLAHRLGLARIRSQLEDGSLKYLEPDIYREIQSKVAMKRREREGYIEAFKTPIEAEIRFRGIEAEISGRAKHFYSIYNKMQSRGMPFEEIYDLLAVRIIVPSGHECYQVLGMVHTLYHPIPDRFKDYVATPKSNMYQSLHTAVIGPGGHPVEIQIRSTEMHHTAEIGIAAHWRYKDGKSDLGKPEPKIPWLREVLDWQSDTTDPQDFIEHLKIELFQDEIFIFTPQGDLHQLPRGATPIDFAFAVHTDIGLHCLNAQVNGQIVAPDTHLSSGDTVHIVTSSQQKPRQDWLEIIKTNKARHAIRRWLREEHHGHSVGLGQEMLESELRHVEQRPTKDVLAGLAADLSYTDTEHMYAAIGRGDLSAQRVINRLRPQTPRRREPSPQQDKRGIRIQGIQNMMIHFGRCCSPIPGDPIFGLITRGRGVSVHRTDCPNIDALTEDPERQVPVAWDLAEEQIFSVQVLVKAIDRPYLLSDLATAISDCQANIRNSTVETTPHQVIDTFWIEVKDAVQLRALLKALSQVSGVSEVQRVSEARAGLDRTVSAN